MAGPLISWVQAGSFHDVADPFQPGDADEWLPCPVAHGPQTYAVRVRGESMFKQLLIEDGRKLLKALNPEWAPRYIPINGNATITGVVIGKWVPE